MPKITFFTEGDVPKVRLPKTKVRNIADRIFADHDRKVDYVNIIFANDDYVLQVNIDYLQHDYYTDIITFDYGDDAIASDIFISLDRVIDNAQKNGVTPENELLRVIFHGCLHLSGLGDKTPAEEKAMRAAEDKYLALV